MNHAVPRFDLASTAIPDPNARGVPGAGQLMTTLCDPITVRRSMLLVVRHRSPPAFWSIWVRATPCFAGARSFHPCYCRAGTLSLSALHAATSVLCAPATKLLDSGIRPLMTGRSRVRSVFQCFILGYLGIIPCIWQRKYRNE
jgi:hypothetical protein